MDKVFVVENYHDIMKPENLPTELPAWPCPGWTIYNAARPMPGHLWWRGDFLHGVFYSAVDLSRPDAAEMQAHCISLDGHPLVHVSKETVETYRVWVKDSFGVETAHYDYHIIVQSLLNALREGGYTLEDENDIRRV